MRALALLLTLPAMLSLSSCCVFKGNCPVSPSQIVTETIDCAVPQIVQKLPDVVLKVVSAVLTADWVAALVAIEADVVVPIATCAYAAASDLLQHAATSAATSQPSGALKALTTPTYDREAMVLSSMRLSAYMLSQHRTAKNLPLTPR